MSTALKQLSARDFDEQRVHLCRLEQSSILIRSILGGKLNFNGLEKEFIKILASHFLDLLSSRTTSTWNQA
ncbi:hypothetical protein HY02_10335 [Peptococcaceae bacterium SCADC1_2_3]|jgi:hypothetical protein|nr:hypothetical protein DK28_0208230 [Peptococcaceae bacterium SCADC1_2_3]KFI36299.1 hypothetical protein HY00_04395 [Peptococcaceae bacterium SCADC1_2_3]KFI37054.1 hypothetical protein HY02_10335 [Peptococcaceae bacterium SCADC1_2_3]HBQ28404.1 hypothetical protein [Desulfotomaculum sp.]HCJ79871.1 hypothetical protein [Desulfotomaculum sp.]